MIRVKVTTVYTLAEARAIIDAEKCKRDGVWCDKHQYPWLRDTEECRARPEVADVAADLLARLDDPTDDEVERAARVIYMAEPSKDGTIAAWSGFPDHVKKCCMDKAREVVAGFLEVRRGSE